MSRRSTPSNPMFSPKEQTRFYRVMEDQEYCFDINIDTVLGKAVRLRTLYPANLYYKNNPNGSDDEKFYYKNQLNKICHHLDNYSKYNGKDSRFPNEYVDGQYTLRELYEKVLEIDELLKERYLQSKSK